MDFKLKRFNLITIFVVLFFINILQITAETLSDAAVLMEKKEYESAIKILNKVIKENEGYAIAHMYLAYSYMMVNKPDKAYENYKIADNISSTPDSMAGKQWALLVMGKYEESIAAGNEILKTEPDNYFARQRIADANMELKKYDAARTDYNKLIAKYGKNGDLLWKLGLCDYYTGDKEGAKKNFTEGAKLDPKHEGIKYSLNNFDSGGGTPYFDIMPEAASYTYHGSDFVGSGQRTGLNVAYAPNEDWHIRAGYTHDSAQNLNPTKGVVNYIIDPLNYLYFGSMRDPATQMLPYYTTGINSYYLYNLASASDYQINKAMGGVTYNNGSGLAFHFSPQSISSNSSYFNGANAVQAGVSITDGYTLSFSVASINMPFNKGMQGSVSLYIPFLEYFYSTSTITGQQMNVKTYETNIYSIRPPVTYTDTVTNSKSYGFFQQELGFASTHFNFAVGGRVGSARTPLIGENWIFTNFDLMSGGYANVGTTWGKLKLQIVYSHDKWKDSRGETPSSDQVKVIAIWRLQ